MAIQGIATTTPTTQTASQQTPPNQTVTQQDFLTLLITELQNQDPLNPMDDQQFATQLATFNSLQQLIDINQALGALQSGQAATNQFNATALIGKEITTSNNTVTFQGGNPVTIGYQLGGNASSVVVTLQDSSGTVVRQLQAGAQSAGNQSIVWNGQDASGNVLPDGIYSFSVSAVDANGNNVPALNQVKGIVAGVELGGSTPMLDVGNVQVPLSSVTTVGAPN